MGNTLLQQSKLVNCMKLVTLGPWWCSGNTLTPTSEIGGSYPGPYVGMLVVAAVYSTEP